MDKNNLNVLVDCINNSILLCQSERIEAIEISDEFFPRIGILSDSIHADFPELGFKLGSEFVNILRCCLCEADFVVTHFLTPKTSSIDRVSPFSISCSDFFMLSLKPGVDSSSRVSRRDS